MTTIVHNGQLAKIRANIGDVISKDQAMRLGQKFGTFEFSDGHRVYHDIHGAGNCWKLLKLAPVPEKAFTEGARFQLLKPDQNEVEDRGEIQVPVGHWAEVKRYERSSGLWVVAFDADADGQDMGWCFYTESEILAAMKGK